MHKEMFRPLKNIKRIKSHVDGRRKRLGTTELIYMINYLVWLQSFVY